MPAARQPSQRERSTAFGYRLRQRRRELRLTQRQVAAQVPMSAANLSRIENGDQGPPSDEAIERLATALQVDPHRLLTDAGRAQTSESFERQVLRELAAMRNELRAGFERLERAISNG